MSDAEKVSTFNLADLFEMVADAVPMRDAIVADPHRRTYAELDARADRVANHLFSAGVAAGDHVGILARNRVEWVEVMIGCFKARMVPVNLNFRYVAPELRYVIENAHLTALFYERALEALVCQAVEGGSADGPGTHGPGSDRLGVFGVDAPGARGSGPAAGLHVVVIDDPEPSGPTDGAPLPTDGSPGPAPVDGSGATARPGVVATPAVVTYEHALASAASSRPLGPRSPDDRYLLYTGGTTGMPKGVMWRQEDIYFAAMGGNGWGGPPVVRPDDVVERIPTDDAARAVMFVAGPLMHGNAQWALWNGLLMGGTVVLYTAHRFDPHLVWQLVERERAVSLALVGDAMARPLAEALASPDHPYDTSSVFVVASGGAMLSATVKRELKQLLPSAIVMDRFGSSESGAQGAVDDGAAGPRFVMGDDTSVLDDELQPLRPGDGCIGRLARRGRIPLGYYGDDAKTAATFPVDEHGVRWSVPGDLATIEPDGTITVLGRGSTSINTGGEKVFPEEVEAAVKTHPQVFDAIVVGVADERFGEQVAVLVQPKAGSRPTLAELQEHCRTRVAGYKVPRRLAIIDTLPLTAAGKPDTRAAKEHF
ncbi:MAG: acyl-CoA synthetase [Actinomycetota bacterium]|nr:acyl-CoA synthetase [Actinomycetota bacterium]